MNEYINADRSDPNVAAVIRCHEKHGIANGAAKYEARTFRTRGITTMGQAIVDAGLRTEEQATVSLVAHKNVARP
jgi:hypothetical protein